MKTMLGAYFMEIFFKNNLNSSDQLQIGQLLSAPTADSAANTGACFVPTPALADILNADNWWFAMQEKDLLLGCMAVYQTGDDSFECVPFVHPDFRRKGIFSTILAAACKEDRIPGEGSVYFSCSAENESWKNILGHIGAEHAWDEYMLERKLIISEKTETDIYCRIVETAPENKTEANDTITSGNIVWHAIGCRLNQNIPLCFTSPEVICFLAPQGESVYLYSLQVLPELRNRHLGTAFLSALLPRLAKKGFKSIKLQVSSENLPAMALYKKTGFYITQTLSFYEY